LLQAVKRERAAFRHRWVMTGSQGLHTGQRCNLKRPGARGRSPRVPGRVQPGRSALAGNRRLRWGALFRTRRPYRRTKDSPPCLFAGLSMEAVAAQSHVPPHEEALA
jgi:hypothetical protein